MNFLMNALKSMHHREEGQGVYIGGGALFVIVLVLLLLLLL
jgi:ABC-type multidrug transport system permease subunit